MTEMLIGGSAIIFMVLALSYLLYFIMDNAQPLLFLKIAFAPFLLFFLIAGISALSIGIKDIKLGFKG